MPYRLRVWLHDLLRCHYNFMQGETQFFICARRWRWQRATEYTVAFEDLEPITVTREQFVNLERRFDTDAPPGDLIPLDEAAAALDVDLARLEDEEDDDA